MPDITMNVDDTLELDTIIENSSRAKEPITVTQGTDYNLSGFQTHTGVFNPQSSGDYTIKVNGQTISIKVNETNSIPKSGLLHRYDATELNLNDGDSFSTLPDEAGNDDLSTGSGGKYNTNRLNGNSVISFSRSDYIETSDGFSSSTPSTWAIFFVAKDSPDSGSFDSLWDDQADSRQHNLYNDNDSPDWELRDGTLRISNADSDWHIWRYEVDDNGNTLIIEDDSNRTDSANNSQPLDGLTLGAESDGHDGTPVDYGEILIYDTSDSGYSKSNVLSYLSGKWGITV